MLCEHANGIGALLLKSSHKRDNARPEPIGSIDQGFFLEPSVSHLLHDRFQFLVIGIVCFPVFGGFQQCNEAMVQTGVIRDCFKTPIVFSCRTFAEASVRSVLGFDIPAQLFIEAPIQL
jgi:hypothetical protein